LRVGFGLATGSNPQFGMGQVAQNLTLERLLDLAPNGRPRPGLAETWSVSDDGLLYRIRLRSGVRFHNGRTVDANVVKDVLLRDLPRFLGPFYDDVQDIRAAGDLDVLISLKRRSTFLLEALEIPIQEMGESPVGTGPFVVVEGTSETVLLDANKTHHAGAPLIDRIEFKPYGSVRSAWADLLRGNVDMLYEVGFDALESLEPSSDVRVFTYVRPYAYVVIFNMRREVFKDSLFRQRLNRGIDRNALIDTALRGSGTSAESPLWFAHWAYDGERPRFDYEPTILGQGSSRPSFTLTYVDTSHERIALVLQQQLQTLGVNLQLEHVPIDLWPRRQERGEFDAVLIDALIGGNLFRPYRFWHSEGQYNLGGFRSRAVDAALDGIRAAENDAAYKAGVARFRQAIVDDPPALFLAWSHRARAVSTRFVVPPSEPGLDVWFTLARWRPAAPPETVN
jgi:peptide/nickel transport system substrate-binding protein